MSNYLKAFGPIIGLYDLPEQLVIDYLVEAKEESGPDFSQNLAGRVRVEQEMTVGLLSAYGSFFKDCIFEYAEKTAPMLKIDECYIDKGWFNIMEAGDYNPVHKHSGCNLSSIGILQLPDGWKDRIDQKDGSVDFIHGTPQDWLECIFETDPPVGIFYLFPHHLLHTVNPFRMEGQRISFSINFKVSVLIPEGTNRKPVKEEK